MDGGLIKDILTGVKYYRITYIGVGSNCTYNINMSDGSLGRYRVDLIDLTGAIPPGPICVRLTQNFGATALGDITREETSFLFMDQDSIEEIGINWNVPADPNYYGARTITVISTKADMFTKVPVDPALLAGRSNGSSSVIS